MEGNASIPVKKEFMGAWCCCHGHLMVILSGQIVPAAQTCGGHCPLFCCGCGYCGLCAVPPIQDQERITCN